MKGGKRKNTASMPDDGNQSLHPPPTGAPAESAISSSRYDGDSVVEHQQQLESVKATVSAAEREDEENQDHEEEEEDDEDEDEDEGEVDGKENREHMDVEGDCERSKLAEGYYEIEAVRKKRVRKGQVQYLIKWRGWPETANTWEPLDNLLSVSDVIDAFEDSLRTGKHRATRRRKRKYANTHPQTKKKQQVLRSPASATYNVPAVKVRILEQPLPFPSLNDARVINHTEGNISRQNGVGTSKQVRENGMSSYGDNRVQYDELDMKLRDLRRVKVTNNSGDKGSAHCPEAQVTEGNDLQKINGVDAVQSDRCTGAKRRKSGSVKRFKNESSSTVANDYDLFSLTNISGTNAASGQQGSQNHDYMSNGFSCKSNFDDCKSICKITEIIKPISYSTSVTNNVQNVLVTFMAKRSDGTEVMVDNKFLKANHPLLLINFYEQHLRYGPT